MILAAGLGTRLEPITNEIPKALVPVLGVPNIVRIIRRLASAGIKEIVINTYWLADILETSLEDGAALGVAIAYSREKTLLGTGGGIKKALPLLGGEPFLVANGDALFAPDFERIAAFHRRTGALATMVVVRSKDAARAGAVGLDGTGQVRHLVWAGERDRVKESFMFTGVHVLSPAIGDLLPDRGCIVRQTYIPMVERRIPLFGLPEKGYFSDLGTPARYLKANADLAQGRHRIADVHPPAGGVYVGSGVSIGERCRLLPGTVIGDGARIAEGITLERSVIFGGASIDESLSNAIVTAAGRIVRVGPEAALS
jgi:NDP-sugar pyrophosphorylase family protein